MSLMLDGRLAARERAELEAHLATCPECQARWAAFQQVDWVLSNAATFAPTPGFVNRFAARLAQQQVELARRARRERTGAWVGVFATGLAALALLVVPALLATWSSLGGFAEGAPTLFVSAVEELARWLVTLSSQHTDPVQWIHLDRIHANASSCHHSMGLCDEECVATMEHGNFAGATLATIRSDETFYWLGHYEHTMDMEELL
jgi:anti-sigma factor RsiW